MTKRKASVGRPRVVALTPPQRRTLETLQRIIARDKLPPTLRELADELGLTIAPVQDQVTQLIQKGFVSREPRKARSLTVLRGFAEEIAELVEVPIVGTVAAGLPVLATENIVGHVTVEGSVARGRCFALKVQGNSMINANIKAGDLVIVRQQPVAEHGDIVVAMVDGDAATVKRLSIREEVIQLCPENPKFRPILIDPDQDFRILGKVVGVRRLKPPQTQ